jgi:hypothetical protein
MDGDTSAGDGSATMTDKDRFNLMASKVIWALKYLRDRGSGMMAYGVNDPNAASIKMIHWTEDFCDALDKCGIKINRDALHALREGRKAKKQKQAQHEEKRHGRRYTDGDRGGAGETGGRGSFASGGAGERRGGDG